MRGEIIDLENKYFTMKSQYESAMAQLGATPGNEDFLKSNSVAPSDTFYTPFDNNSGNSQPEEIFRRPDNDGSGGSVLDRNRTQPEELPKRDNTQRSPDDLNLDIKDDDENNSQGSQYRRPRRGEVFGANELIGPSNTLPNSQPQKKQRRTNAQDWIRAIRLSQEKTAGQNLDQNPGHDGLMVVVQPIDQDGNVIPVAGDMTISIIDPKAATSRQRISFYRLPADEVEEMLETSEALGPGIHLPVAWNHQIPQHADLKVFVRFTSENNRRFEASMPVQIQVPTGSRTQNGDQFVDTDSDQNIEQGIPASPASSRKRPQWRPRR